MLCARSLLTSRSFITRAYATATSPHALVLLEHKDGAIEPASLSALTAAQQLGGAVTGLVVGSPDQVPPALERAKKYIYFTLPVLFFLNRFPPRLKGLSSVLHSTSPQYASKVPEIVSPLIEKLLAHNPPYTHVVSAHSSSAKALLPRIAAKLDVPAVSDIISVSHDSASNSTTFTRPIYAGNAIATVRAPSSISLKFFTVRSTAFSAAPEDDGASVALEELAPVEVTDSPTQHIKTDLTKSDRPELGAATRVVSGGRALKNAETFKATLDPLADALGAAVGASRAAVDAGYADNSLQVGQTGKVVAPELYVAVGISGAIQHLAGMKDSKLIVAINKVNSPSALHSLRTDYALEGSGCSDIPGSGRRASSRFIRSSATDCREAQEVVTPQHEPYFFWILSSSKVGSHLEGGTVITGYALESCIRLPGVYLTGPYMMFSSRDACS
jgi:electron transfer flavoprotein alpha subunit